MARLVIENLGKQFKAAKKQTTTAVKGLSLSVEDGEFMVLVGPSGCGKSTTLRLIAGLEEPDAGTITIGGRAMNGVEPKDRDIAMVFQNHALYPHMTARENLAFGLTVRRLPRVEVETRIREAAEMLGLNGCLDRRPEQLSGGERQRVALGRAIVRKPGVFLFDEPLSNLDGPLRAQLRREIAALHQRLRATMIFVTHDQMEAMTMGDRIAVMHEGAVQQAGKPLELYQNPANLFVAGFIGAPRMNLFEGTIIQSGQDVLFKLCDGGPESPRLQLNASAAGGLGRFNGKNLILGVRPENLRPDARDGIEMQAESLETTGADTYLHARFGGQPLIMRLNNGEKIPPMEKLKIAFDMDAARWFDPASGKAIV